MKRILYLDKEFMDSYLAQSREGLPGQHIFTNANKAIDAQAIDQPSVTHTVSGKVNGSLLAISGEGAYEREITTESQHNYSLAAEGATEAITLLPHDNALQDVIKLSGAEENHGKEIGSFIITCVDRPMIYDVMDIASRIDDDVIQFIAEKTVDEQLKKLPPSNEHQTASFRKNAIKEQVSSLKEARSYLEITCKLAQFDVCVVMGDVIAPLKRQYMRTSTRDMAFKYDSRLYLFGQITKMQDSSSNNQSSNPVEVLNDLFNGVWPQALQQLKILPEGDYWVIDPMAVYFE